MSPYRCRASARRDKPLPHRPSRVDRDANRASGVRSPSNHELLRETDAPHTPLFPHWLREQGLEQMEKLRVAMLPVDQAMAKKKHWDHMPLDELVAALSEKAKGVVLRVDKPMPTTQEQVVEDRLFFEVAF
jgi:hypothetical protein